MKNLGLSDKIYKKIVSKNFIKAKIKTLNQCVVMCHGTFDLVHPGHIRHLAFAKSLGDILIVSITADEFINKANIRPYIPQDMRALNLAALEIVDFVIIDDELTPLNLIKELNPNKFVKGYDYQSMDNIQTIHEKTLVESYGGEFFFSPGDYVMSSSQIIESNPPNVSLEKLDLLLQAENLEFEDLFNCLNNLDKLKIYVIGDLIVDSVSEAAVIGGFRKTPTASVKIISQHHFVGGAGVVAKHVSSAGAKVTLGTVIGKDSLGEFALNDLANNGVDVKAHYFKNKPTTHKNSLFVKNNKILQIDEVDNSQISAEIVESLVNYSQEETYDLIIFSDFRHGVFNKDNISRFMGTESSLKAADSQVASRWGNILDFKHCDILTPNEEEIRFALGDQDSVIRPLGTKLFNITKAKLLILKLGDKGSITFRRNPSLETNKRDFFSLDAINLKPVVDPVGSGDALLSYSTLAFAQSKNEVISSILGGIAAGICCESMGNVPVSVTQMNERLKEIEKKLSY